MGHFSIPRILMHCLVSFTDGMTQPVTETTRFHSAQQFLVDLHRHNLSGFPTDVASKLDVLGYGGGTLGMINADVGVLTDFLQERESCALEAQVEFEILCDFFDQVLERNLRIKSSVLFC